MSNTSGESDIRRAKDLRALKKGVQDATALRIIDETVHRLEIRGARKLNKIGRKKKKLNPERIDLVPAIAEILTTWADKVEYGYIFPGNCSPCVIERRKGPDEMACPGGHISLRAIQRRWELTVAKAGLHMHGRGIHSLRHFAITQFYAKYRDLRAAQLFAGHSSSQITERYASVLDMAEKIQAMEPYV